MAASSASSEYFDSEPRRARVFLLDASGSASDEPVEQVNKGLVHLEKACALDQLAPYRVEVEILAFDSNVELVCDFMAGASFEPLVPNTQSGTFTVPSVLRALARIEGQKAYYKSQGLPFHRPWLFLSTDGQIGDSLEDLQNIKRRLYKARAGRRAKVFAAWGRISLFRLEGRWRSST